jgi:amidophosphoribosyltransferase
MIAGYGVLAFRDPYGIRPLVIGTAETEPAPSTWSPPSRSRSMRSASAGARRRAGRGDPHRRGRQLPQPQCAPSASSTPCIFEYVYLARPDSVIDGVSVYETRLQDGREPGREDPREYGHVSTSTS